METSNLSYLVLATLMASYGAKTFLKGLCDQVSIIGIVLEMPDFYVIAVSVLLNLLC